MGAGSRRFKSCRPDSRRIEDQPRPLASRPTRASPGGHRAGGAGAERAAQLADLQERVQRTERRLAEIDSQLTSLGRDQISESEVVDALREFDQVWNVLAPREQVRLLELLIEKVQYDGENSRVSITFHPCGLRSLTEGLATTQEKVAS